jgi:hypothetical protein
MTYNFDPDKWLENERLRLEMRQRAGTLGPEEASKALEELERRYDAMRARLDGTFPVGSRNAPKPSNPS